MIIQIDSQTEKEIAQGINKAQRLIEKEESYDELKNEETIERQRDYISQMNQYLEQGYITI